MSMVEPKDPWTSKLFSIVIAAEVYGETRIEDSPVADQEPARAKRLLELAAGLARDHLQLLREGKSFPIEMLTEALDMWREYARWFDAVPLRGEGDKLANTPILVTKKRLAMMPKADLDTLRAWLAETGQ